MPKSNVPKITEVEKQLDIINDFNVGSFGKNADFKNASTFQAKRLEESTGKVFGSRLTKRLKKTKELDF